MQVRYQAALRPENANYNLPVRHGIAAAAPRDDIRLRPQKLEDALDFLADVDAGTARRARGLGRLGDELVEAVAGAADREALVVQELADAADEQDFVVLVIAAVAAALDGF